MQMFSFNIHPACHSDAKGIKPGSNQTMIDKHAAEYSKAVFWDVKLICVRCRNCSYYKKARSIGLLDKIAICVCTGKFSYK